jgi:alpha-amylase/alpha-mannosidase (GH57 family)
MWPAEGSISNSTLNVMAEEGCGWAASGEGVLVNSLNKMQQSLPSRSEYLYRPYSLAQGADGLSCFFRDDQLSDLIGFEYSQWHGSDAANHFIAQIEAIAQQALTGESKIVSVILDGENAWEYYPYNGFYFLDQLYAKLETHPDIQTNTYSNYLKSSPKQSVAKHSKTLPNVVAGSWVYGNFSTWIGWFWWFGDYNPSDSVASFDRLFRHNLSQLYHLLKLSPPASLSEPVSQGSLTTGVSGAMRRSTD